MVYPGGLSGLRKKSKSSYSETGKAKCEWADKIGRELILENNISPSFRKLLSALQIRIEAACYIYYTVNELSTNRQESVQ